MKTISISEIRNLILNEDSTVIKFEVINPKGYVKTTERISYISTSWYKKYTQKQVGDIILPRGNKEFNLSELERIMSKHIGDMGNMWYTLNGKLLSLDGILSK